MNNLSFASRRASAVLVVLGFGAALAACSGGGGSSPAPVSLATATASATATPFAGPTPPPPAAGNGYALFYFQLSGTSAPNGHLRRPDFVAPNAEAVEIDTSGPNAPTGGSGVPATAAKQVTTFGANQSNCQSQPAGLVCYAYVQVPVGSGYAFQLFLEGPNGIKVSQGNTGTTSITSAGSTTAQVLEYNPIVASISLALASGTVPKGTPTNVPLTVILRDALGNDLSKTASGGAIVKGSGDDQIFAGSVSLASSDATDAPVSIVKINRPSDLAGITVNYDGSATTGPYTITASISSAAAATATLTPQ